MANFSCYADMNIEAAVNATDRFSYDNLSGTFSLDLNDTTGGESLTWSGGTGVLWGDNGVDTMYIEVTSGTDPADGQTITGGTSGATCDVDGSLTAIVSMADGEDINVYNGATIKITKTPPVLIGSWNLLGPNALAFVDGVNIDSGNSINIVGEWGQDIEVYASSEMRVEGGWHSIGTTNGTSGQTFDLATFYNSSFCVGWLPMIQVETGRRIDYDGASGTTPEVDDIVRKVSDPTVLGRIVEVNAGSSYILVKYLTGSLANDDEIEVEKLVENNGPDLQISWTADVNNASGDVKEAGIYQEFGNVTVNSGAQSASFGSGISGFVFDNDFQSTTLTMATSLGGFIPPSGCNVRAPNVIFTSSNLTNYALGNTYNDGSTSIAAWYNIEATRGGNINLSVCNFGGALAETDTAGGFVAEYVGTSHTIGSTTCATKSTFAGCVFTANPVTDSSATYCTNVISCNNGVEIIDSLFITPLITGGKIYVTNITGFVFKGNIVSKSGSIAGSTYSNYLMQGSYSTDVLIENNFFIFCDKPYAVLLAQFSSFRELVVRFNYFSVAQDYSTQVDSILMDTSDCFEAYICGILFIGGNASGGFPKDTLLILAGSSPLRAKLRCVGRIDDKVNLGAYNATWLTGYSYTDGLDIARVWKKGGTGPNIRVYRTYDKDVQFKNVSHNYSAVGSGQMVFIAEDVQYKGFHYASFSRNICYGPNFHDGFVSDTAGAIQCVFMPPSNNVNNITIVSGNPYFRNTCLFDMYDGDEIIFEQDYFCLGHLAFSGTCNLYGSGSSPTTWPNVAVTFQYDIGTGWNGTWLDIGVSSNWTGITGISDGVKLKYRMVASGTQINMFRIEAVTTTTLSTQAANLYPIDQEEAEITVTVKGLEDSSVIEGAVVYIVAGADGPLSEGTEIMNILTDSAGIAQITMPYTDDQPIQGKVLSASGPKPYLPLSLEGIVTDTGFTYTALLVRDE